MALVASAYAEVGMRAVIAPMIADRSFFEAIPGLHDALPEALRERVAALRLPPGDATLAAVRARFKDWSFDRDPVRPALAPNLPPHYPDQFIPHCSLLARDCDRRLHHRVPG